MHASSIRSLFSVGHLEGQAGAPVPLALTFLSFTELLLLLLLASSRAGIQEQQHPHRQNLTHRCVLIAAFGVPFLLQIS